MPVGPVCAKRLDLQPDKIGAQNPHSVAQRDELTMDMFDQPKEQ